MTALAAAALAIAVIFALAAAALAGAAIGVRYGRREESARLIRILSASRDMEVQIAGHHLACELAAEAPTDRIPRKVIQSTQPQRVKA